MKKVLLLNLLLISLIVIVPAVRAEALYKASFVLGQPDFTSSSADTTAQGFSMNGAMYLEMDEENELLFVSEPGNNRVLVFDTSDGITNNEDAVAVLGQPDFTTGTSDVNEKGFNWPQGIKYAKEINRLFVADRYNHRVLVFDTSDGITSNEDAIAVLGQPDFVSNTADLNAKGFSNPLGIEYDHMNERLFVTDGNRRRVLVFDTSDGITNNEDAVAVLGQPDFTTGTSDVNAKGFNFPSGALFNPETEQLFVADTSNHRILVFDTSDGITNNEDAVAVIGQPDFTTNSTGITSQKFSGVRSISFAEDRSKLFVTETSNSRVLVFDLSDGVTSNEAAIAVIGQADFTTNTPGLGDSQLNGAQGLKYIDLYDQLFVADTNNQRILVFNFAKFLGNNTNKPVKINEATFGEPYLYALSTAGAQGAITCSLVSGALPEGIALSDDCIISGTPLSNTVYNFSILLSDDNGNAGVYTDTQDFTLTVNHAVLKSQQNMLADSGENAYLYVLVAFLLLAGSALFLKNHFFEL